MRFKRQKTKNHTSLDRITQHRASKPSQIGVATEALDQVLDQQVLSQIGNECISEEDGLGWFAH